MADVRWETDGGSPVAVLSLDNSPSDRTRRAVENASSVAYVSGAGTDLRVTFYYEGNTHHAMSEVVRTLGNDGCILTFSDPQTATYWP